MKQENAGVCLVDASVKIQSLQKKISALQETQHQFIQERNKQIIALLLKCDLSTIDDTLLLGAFYFVREKILAHDPLVEVWRKAGTTFLGNAKKKSINRSSSQKRAATSELSSSSIEQGDV